MPSAKCVLCGAPLTATRDSSEHILLHRQRSGALPPVKVRKPDGGELLLDADGLMAQATPTFQAIETDRGRAISIVARSKRSARSQRPRV